MNPLLERVRALVLSERGIPGKLRAMSFEDLGEASEVVAARAFVEGLQDRHVTSYRPEEYYPADRSLIGKGLMLSGPPGTGKTTLAGVTLVEIMDRWPNLPVMFAAYADVVTAEVTRIRLDKQLNTTSPAGVREEFNEVDGWLSRVRNAPVLVLDDVGKERRTGSGFAEDHFDALLRERHRNMRPSIVTTNLRPQDWETTYNASMASFVHEAFEMIPMVRPDRRRD